MALEAETFVSTDRSRMDCASAPVPSEHEPTLSPPTIRPTAFLIAQYSSALALARAIRRLRDMGVTNLEAYTSHAASVMRQSLRRRQRRLILSAVVGGGVALALVSSQDWLLAEFHSLADNGAHVRAPYVYYVIASKVGLVAVTLVAVTLLLKRVTLFQNLCTLRALDAVHVVHGNRHWLRIRSAAWQEMARERTMLETTAPVRVMAVIADPAP